MQTITATTDQVFNHHIGAIRNRDLQANMADYHKNAVLITSTDVFRGKEAIQGFFQYVFDAILTEGFTIDIQKQVVEDDFIFVVWVAHSKGFHIPYASDTFLIQDGLIMRQTAYAVINPV